MLRGVLAGYGRRTVLWGLCADFPRGRVTAVLGPGGSGKSTLLRVVQGSTPELWCSGEIPRVSSWLLPQPGRFQRVELDERLLVANRLCVERWIATRSGVLTPSIYDALLRDSNGLLRISRILSAGADVLLLDEPDARVDQRVVDVLVAVLRALAGEGTTVVLVTHNLALVDRIADHVLLLVDGLKLDEGSYARVRARPASERVRQFFTWGA